MQLPQQADTECCLDSGDNMKNIPAERHGQAEGVAAMNCFVVRSYTYVQVAWLPRFVGHPSLCRHTPAQSKSPHLFQRSPRSLTLVPPKLKYPPGAMRTLRICI